MDSDIRTLIPDIYRTLERSDGKKFGDVFVEQLASETSIRVQRSLRREEGKPVLRLSQMGDRCPKALWYSLHHPELEEPLPAWVRIKFAYGHILEALVLALAKEAGHRVEGEQDELSLLGVKGHRDAVIDGATVDIKSCSSFQFQKIKEGSIEHNDSFGYLRQLDGYVVGAADDPLVTIKDKGYILAVDKTLGHLAIYEHTVRPTEIQERIRRAIWISEQDFPPPCECGTRPEGNSGNIGLDIKASYSSYKHCCFPGLRTFIYAAGPKFLVKVEREPDVPELVRHGMQIPRMSV
jgi:hypothetical protein